MPWMVCSSARCVGSTVCRGLNQGATVGEDMGGMVDGELGGQVCGARCVGGRRGERGIRER